MISVTDKKWQEKKVNLNILEKTQQEHGFSRILSQLIVSRNFDKNEIYQITKNLDLVNMFSNNLDFKNAIEIISNTIKKKEKICILGDYDVDGSAATSLFVKFFDYLNHPFFYYIPDRVKDGYGASIKLFKKLILNKPKLIIMVDCGSSSVEAIDFLNRNNIKSLIIDHHEIDRPYPKSNVIINPKKNNGYIEYDYLCATSLVYFFLEILKKRVKTKINLRKHLIYVLLATVCDVMPIRKLNRLIAINTLKEFDLNKCAILKRLYEITNIKKKIDIDDLSFLVGPILNAGGRLGKSSYAVELLSSNNKEEIDHKLFELIELNNKRKKIETNILNNINYEKINKENKEIIFYYEQNINEGLIGIIAARLKDYFNKPAIVITNSNNLLKGSARSVENYNIGRSIKISLNKNIILNGGGHSAAAGFSLKKENLLTFKNFLITDIKKKYNTLNLELNYDAEISSIGFNKEFFNDIKRIGPFGAGNPLPIFLFKELKIIKSKILSEKHISCVLKSKIGFSMNSICFNAINTKVGDYLLNYKKYLNVMGQINENFWNNKKNLQIIIKDLVL